MRGNLASPVLRGRGRSNALPLPDQNAVRGPKFTVSADGSGIVSQAGTLLLTETARITGLAAGLTDRLGWWLAPRAVHDPGKIVVDLAVRSR